MLFAVLAFAAIALTCAMFATKNSMLGFPSAIFWAITGGQAYTLSTVTWDIYYLIFFASAFGMTIFCVVGAYGLREKRDTLGDEDMEKGDGDYFDEVPESQSRRKQRIVRRAVSKASSPR